MTTTQETMAKTWRVYIAALEISHAARRDYETARAAYEATQPRSFQEPCPVCLSKDYGNGELMHRPRCPALAEEEGRELDG